MKNAGKGILMFILIGNACIFFSTLINYALFQICVWLNMDHAIAWQALKPVQIITIPISGILALASVAIKIQRKDLTKHLPKRLHSKIITIFKVRDCVFLLLMFTSGLHERYVGHVGDEYVLARAQVFLLMFNCGLMAISEYNIGFSDRFKRL